MLACAATTTGCGGAAPAPVTASERAAEVEPGCTQEDLPALVFRIRLNPRELLSIEIAGFPKRSNETRRYELSPLARGRSGSATRLARGWLTAADGSPQWLRGSVTLRSVIPGSGAAGEYAMVTAQGRTITGRFQATWRSKRAMCG